MERQYCDVLKQVNRQSTMSLSVASDRLRLPVACEVYPPDTRTENGKLRRRTAVPNETVFRTRLEIALDRMDTAVEKGAPCVIVLGSGGYVDSTVVCDGISAIGPTYVVGIQANRSVSPGGEGPAPAPEH
ncbi:hypothetical protein EG829_13685 [bacterium]|nr:hypothetical protein [bacterium]